MHGMILVEADRIPKEQFLEQFAELCLHLVEAATILGFKPLDKIRKVVFEVLSGLVLNSF